MYCSACGKSVANGSVFCMYCGVRLPEEESARPGSGLSELLATREPGLVVQALQCPMCGASVKHHLRECTYCGSTLVFISLSGTLSLNLDTAILNASVSKWREVLRHDAENPDANYALGVACLNKGLRDAALLHLRKAALLSPESPTIHYNLALALFADGNTSTETQEWAEMTREIDYTLRLDPQFREAVAFSSFFAATGLARVDAQAAIREYNKAIRTCPDIAIFHLNIGRCFFRTRDYLKAEGAFQEAIRLDPSQFGAYSNLCSLCFATGEYGRGVQAGRAAVEHMRPTSNPLDQAGAYHNLSLCLWMTGQIGDATEMMKRAIALSPQVIGLRQGSQTLSVPVVWKPEYGEFPAFILSVDVLACAEACYDMGLRLQKQKLLVHAKVEFAKALTASDPRTRLHQLAGRRLLEIRWEENRR